jgi:alanyl-tRNA synthetase
VLGEHARQAGSLVAPDRLRFDFTHSKALSPEEIARLEHQVNQAILENHRLEARMTSREQALSEGAIALFGETYGETVRTVRIGGEQPLSLELCGGTHVPETAMIGPFVIVSEGSVAAGIRRLEALTGRAAQAWIQSRLRSLNLLTQRLGTSAEGLEERLEGLLNERDDLAHKLDAMRERLADTRYEKLAPQEVAGAQVLTGVVPDAPAETLRHLVDRFRSEQPTGVVVLGSAPEGQPILVAGVSSDLVARGLHAGDLVKEVAKVIGGGGGGKPTLAQAGGKDASRLEQALELVGPWVESHIH